MYFHPRAKNPYGLPTQPKKRGRPSNLSKFLAKQGDLFPAERYLAGLEAQYPHLQGVRAPGAGAAGAARSGSEDGDGARPLPPATNRGGKSQNERGNGGNE